MKILTIVRWAPRIITILAICFVSLFALDSFDPSFTLWKQIQAFAMHMIPTVVLTIFLLVAWKMELVGGIILCVLSLGLMPPIYMGNYQMNHSVWMSLGVILMILFPFTVAGALFILSHFLHRKNAPPAEG
jgi:cell division protein FtsW (lipid II flippase)